MTKTEFIKQITLIIAKSPCNKPIRKDWADWLLPLLCTTSSYGKKAARPDIQLIVAYRKFGPRKSKFLVLKEANKELIIGKAKLIEAVYPTKSKRTPEQKHRGTILSIFRRLIEPQIFAFKKQVKQDINDLAKAGKIKEAKLLNTCKLSGKSLNSCKTACDHVVPFAKLVDDWLISQNLQFKDISVKGRGSNKYFEEQSLMQDWYDYHAEHAVLQMVCSKANSSAGAKGYTCQGSSV